jgi:hypothetical protein
MWQDGLALLIVLAVFLAWLRHWRPWRWLHGNHSAHSVGQCTGCALRPGCSKINPAATASRG